MTQFNETVKQNFPKLKLFTLAITRAHGKNHAEVFEVRDLFKTMNKKVKQAKKINHCWMRILVNYAK